MDYWDMPQDWSEQYLQQFEPVLYAVLKKYHVSKTNPEYLDLLQIGRIFLLETYQKIGGNPFEEKRFIYVTYIKRGFTWLCLGYFSKVKRQTQHECQDETLEFMLGETNDIQEQLEIRESLEEMFTMLTPRQKKTLELFLNQSYSIKELAKIEGRCKSKYYRDREAIQRKYQECCQGGKSNGRKNS